MNIASLILLSILLTTVCSEDTTELPSSTEPLSSTELPSSTSASETSTVETSTENIELSDDPKKIRQAYCESRYWIFSSVKGRELKWVATMACECMRYQKWHKDAKKCYGKSFKDGETFLNCTTLEGLQKFSCQDKYDDIEKEVKSCINYNEAKMETAWKHPVDKCYNELMEQFDTSESWLGQVSTNPTYEKAVKAAARYHGATPGDPDKDKKKNDPMEKAKGGFKFLLGK